MRLVSSTWTLAVLTSCGAALLLTACAPIRSVTVGENRHPDHREIHGRGGHGPPPHAPAHGYRRKQQQAYHHQGGDAKLAFDSDLGVYVVLDLPHHYYFDGVYLRIEDGSREFRDPVFWLSLILLVLFGSFIVSYGKYAFLKLTSATPSAAS